MGERKRGLFTLSLGVEKKKRERDAPYQREPQRQFQHPFFCCRKGGDDRLVMVENG